MWQVQWTDTGPAASALVSISTDGRVTRWHISKGLEYEDLIKLKRVARRTPGGGRGVSLAVARAARQDAFISRLTSGMALDFSKHDERIYLAGVRPAVIGRESQHTAS